MIIGSKNTTVYFGAHCLKNLILHLNKLEADNRKVFLLADTNSINYCMPLIAESCLLPNKRIFILQAGEKSKSLDALADLYAFLIEGEADRSSVLLNLGGGVISDMGGFAASTFKRGMGFINIPTTLIGMIDAALGGKTGINVGTFKNQAGSFSNPLLVFIFPGFLSTLNEMEKWSGVAEMYKTALVANKQLFTIIKSAASLDNIINDDHLLSTVLEKINITDTDPYEVNKRKILNFGHTMGHAFESVGLLRASEEMNHGKAVAAGMVCECFISARMGLLPEIELYNIIEFLLKNFAPVDMGPEEFEQLVVFIKSDKKRVSGRNSFTLLKCVGDAVTDQNVPDKLIGDSLHFYRNCYGQE